MHARAPGESAHSQARILVIEDDRELLDLLAYSLGRNGFTAIPTHDPSAAADLFQEQQPDLVVLDVNLGVWNGLDVLQWIRRTSATPVILLTALDGEDDKVRGLELGADDYLTKPFSHAELLARIRARLRDQGRAASPRADARQALSVGPLQLDPGIHAASAAGRPLHLTATEFRLLHYLMLHPGSVVPTDTLARHLWGQADDGRFATVRTLVHRLRRKIEADPARPSLLQTVPRAGILLRDPDQAEAETPR